MLNIDELKFDEKGLIPAIVVDANTQEVLTLAYMNKESLEISIKEKKTCFWSRSRKELWRKGETSGNVQRIVSITADCDGDALVVEDETLEYVISNLRKIPHVEIIRIGSRTPVVMPQRITPELCNIFKKYHPIWLNTHFNTPKEITPEAQKACAMLADAGIPLGNQSVLLAGVNDCSHVMMDLVHELVKMRVRPYYIYACDPSLGLSHFRTPVSKGIEIIEALRGHTSGYCVPTFVVDAPGGGGKTPVMPNYLISQTPHKVILRNFEGVITSYTQPMDYVENCHCDVCTGKKTWEKTGVAWVAQGTPQRYLEPTKLLRHERHTK